MLAGVMAVNTLEKGLDMMVCGGRDGGVMAVDTLGRGFDRKKLLGRGYGG